MNSMTMFAQSVDYQKKSFDNAFAIMTSLQDQGHKVMDLAFEKTLLPDNGKRICSYWVGVIKQGQDNYKEYVDRTFDRLKELFPATEPVYSPAPAPVSSSALKPGPSSPPEPEPSPVPKTTKKSEK